QSSCNKTTTQSILRQDGRNAQPHPGGEDHLSLRKLSHDQFLRALGRQWFNDAGSRLWPKVNFAPFPAFNSNVVEQAEPVTPGPAVIRIVGRPEGDGIHTGGFGQLDSALDRATLVVPIKKQVLPL